MRVYQLLSIELAPSSPTHICVSLAILHLPLLFDSHGNAVYIFHYDCISLTRFVEKKMGFFKALCFLVLSFDYHWVVAGIHLWFYGFLAHDQVLVAHCSTNHLSSLSI